MERRRNAGSQSAALTVVAAGAPGAGTRREGAVLLVWLRTPHSIGSRLNMPGATELDPAAMYSRAQPGTTLDDLPEVAAWRVLGVSPQPHCRYSPGFCLSPADMGLILPESVPLGSSPPLGSDPNDIDSPYSSRASLHCQGEMIEVKLDASFRGSTHLPSVGMIVDPRPRDTAS